uniref:Amino acid transporter n=1 Tax=Timema genevievae TaxID=629358 RepID=A0A7R9PLH0_TIMGE|nr:unnamed protein product [Timema genevievae]
MSSLGAQVHDSLAAVGRAITGLNNKGNRDDQQTDGQDASEIGSGGEDDDKQAVIPVPEPKTPSVQPSIVYQISSWKPSHHQSMFLEPWPLSKYVPGTMVSIKACSWNHGHYQIYRNYHSLGEAYTHMEKLTITWRSLHSHIGFNEYRAIFTVGSLCYDRPYPDYPFPGTVGETSSNQLTRTTPRYRKTAPSIVPHHLKKSGFVLPSFTLPVPNATCFPKWLRNLQVDNCIKTLTLRPWFVQVLTWMKQNLLLMLTIASVLVGVAIGFLGRLARLSDGSIMLVSFPGEILMRLLKMFILPLIISSLVSGTITLPTPSYSYLTLLRTDCKDPDIRIITSLDSGNVQIIIYSLSVLSGDKTAPEWNR